MKKTFEAPELVKQDLEIVDIITNSPVIGEDQLPDDDF